MITLSNAAVINSVIGGNVPIDYDKFVLSALQIDPMTGNIRAQVRLTSISNPEMDAITGTLLIDGNSHRAVIEVSRLDFYKSAVLTTAQQNAVQTIINNAQNAVENGMISIGFVSGTQSTGV